MKLPREFYLRPDVTDIAKDLLGKFLVTSIQGELSSGMIVETEAYSGRDDKACHANNGRRTKRTEVMFHEGGRAYVYLCYGIHHLFNVTTNEEGLADAVLVRGVEPVDNLDLLLKRRNMLVPKPNLTAGPGALSRALGITTNMYGEDLLGSTIWIEDRGVQIDRDKVCDSKRVGVDYAEEDALRPWRYTLKDNLWVSRPKP